MKRRNLLQATPAAAGLITASWRPGFAAGDLGSPNMSVLAQANLPVRGGTLTAAMARDATNFDPLRQNDVYSAVVLNNVVDSLFELNESGSVVGRLVEKSENPEPNVYIWTLRKGIKFHDGTDLNAEAVKFNLQRHIDDPRSVRSQDVKDVTALDVLDPFTLMVTLKTAFAPFANKLTGGAGYILSPAAVQKLGEALQRDLTGVGSGAYKFTQWQKDTQVLLDRNTSYWKRDAGNVQLPYLDKLVFKPFPDENVRLTNLQTGDADVLIANPPYKDVADLKRHPDLVVKEIAGIGWSFISMNIATEPFNNVNIRRAFSYALDREAIRKVVYYDNGKVLDSPIPDSIPWAYESSPAAHPYLRRDLVRARQEIQASGKTGPIRFTFQISNASPELLLTAEFMKDQIKEVGLEMEIQLIEFATVVANGGSGNYQALGLGWSGDTDPDTLYSLFYTGAGFNFAKYSNPELDALLDFGRSNVDQTVRADAYKQVQNILFQDQPFIVYWNSPQISTVRKVVQNYPQTYNGYWGARDFDKVWKTGR